MTEHTQHTVKMAPIMTLIATTNFVAMMNSITITIVLPVFMRQFNTGILTVQWLVTGYMLATCIVAPIVGYIADRLSLKKTFLASVAGFAIATFLIGCANSIQMLILLRVLQGLFGGMIMPLTQSMIYQVFPRHQQSQAVSIWATTNLLAPTLAPSLGGIICDLLSWRFIFFIQVPVMVLIIVATTILVPFYKNQETVEKHPFDFAGLIMSMIGSVCLLMAFSNIAVWGLLNGKTLGLAAIGLVTLIAFFTMEYKKAHPLLYARVFSYEGFISSVIIMCIGMMMTNTSNNILPIYLQNVLGLNTTQAALAMLPAPLVIMFIIPIMGKYYDIMGPQKMLTIIMLLGVVSCFALGALGPGSSIIFFIAALILRDMGGGTTNMPATNMGMQAVPPQYATHAAAVMSWMKQCVASLAIGLANTFTTTRTEHYMSLFGDYNRAYCGAVDDYFHLFTICFIVGLVAIYFSKSHKKNA